MRSTVSVPALPAVALLALALTACNADKVPAASTATGDTAPAAPTASVPPLDQPSQDVPPATAPPATAMPGPTPGTFQGYGKARFGMSADEVRGAWGGTLEGATDNTDDCHYLRPQQADDAGWPALMIEGGKFVRYDVETVADVAPGGGQVGMTADQIRAAYAGRVEQSPHKYVEGGSNLRVKSDDGASAVVFEVGADGKVSAWHVGVPPQVDYVEGCS